MTVALDRSGAEQTSETPRREAPPDAALHALAQRLAEVAPVLDAGDAGAPDPTLPLGARTAELLLSLVTAVQQSREPARVWLLLVAVGGVLPLDEEVRAARRQLELAPPPEGVLWLLDWGAAVAAEHASATSSLRLVRSGVVVDVDFTARHDLQTGIQRVVRRLAPRWARDHDIELAVWTERSGALRVLDDDEEERVLRWQRPLHRLPRPRSETTLLVPWEGTVVLPEVPGRDQCARLAALAEHSGNRVTMVGYYCIPVVSAELMPAAEPTRFVRYLTVVKHADAVAGISRSAAEEFRGFTAALPAQGLAGPEVVAVPLATDAPAPADDVGNAPVVPEVLVVGSHEPRKNHLAVLHAAEVLWREGHAFRLHLIGGPGWTTTAFDARLEALRRAGRPVEAQRSVDDDGLWRAYRRARFTVFPSLHEGYGLPVVESLTLGTPVVATSYGSIAELAADGGVVPVDPHDDDALTAAMRSLLTDDARLEALRAEARARPLRTWDDYARDLWQALVEHR
ncbi:MAG: glycosyltransferase family 4 protein [Actinomycetes bacterium]